MNETTAIGDWNDGFGERTKFCAVTLFYQFPWQHRKLRLLRRSLPKPLIIGLKIIPINATFSLVDPSSHEKIPPLIPLKAAPYSAKISADGKKNKIAVTIY